MKRAVFLCCILVLLLVLESKKYLVDVDDDDRGGKHLKRTRLSKKNQDSDEVSDEIEDIQEEDIEETKDEETLIESRGNKYFINVKIIPFLTRQLFLCSNEYHFK